MALKPASVMVCCKKRTVLIRLANTNTLGAIRMPADESCRDAEAFDDSNLAVCCITAMQPVGRLPRWVTKWVDIPPKAADNSESYIAAANVTPTFADKRRGQAMPESVWQRLDRFVGNTAVEDPCR